MLGIYVHVPFCERKCIYCAFSSFTNKDSEEEKYISHLTKEIVSTANNLAKKSRDVDSIYIGGGTPSILSLHNIELILVAIRQNFIVAKDCEVTIECNPNSISYEKLKFYKKLGINRISLGVQSLYDEDLKFLNRLHNSHQVIDVIKSAKEAGFENISVDLLIGIMGQTKQSFISQLKILKDLGVKHFSCYMLQIEDGTPLKSMLDKNLITLPNDDQSVEIYNACANYLKENGFERYEVSNFALKGYESRHNSKYWLGEDYIGFGLSAHSYINKVRSANSSVFENYYENKKCFEEKLTNEELIEEHIMLGLRCKYGVDKNYLQSLGYNIEKNNNFKELKDKKIILNDKKRLFLNPEYYGVNNYIILKLLP